MKQIFISGSLFSWNLGTAAMAMALIDQFDKNNYLFFKSSVDLSNDRFNFASQISQNKLKIIGFDRRFLPMFLASPLSLLVSIKYLKKADIILECPGEIPTAFSLISQLARFCAAKLFKKKFIICGCSLGPFKDGYLKYLALWIYKNTDGLLLRENLSFQYLSNMGLKNCRLTSDNALLLLPEKTSAINNILKNYNNFVGITVKHKYFYNCSDYRRQIEQLILYITEKLEKKVIIISHGKEDDLPSKLIYERAKGKNVYLLEGNYLPGEIKWLISQAEFFIGSRIHACLSALSTGVPTIIFIPKMDHRSLGFANSFHLPEMVVDPVYESNLLEVFMNLYPKRKILSKKIVIYLPELKSKAFLNVEFVKDLLK